ncbi:MAG: heavy metal translocating P-type ATPase [Eubacteriales bacterium]|nr:heavy metal translocating P-type ATPase [Eubacteriales bacterium]
MNRKQQILGLRILAAALCLIGLHFVELDPLSTLLLYLIPYLIVGYDVLKKAGLGLFHGRLLDENFLMSLATLGALILSLWKHEDSYIEAVAVMLFYQIGELFENYAIGKTRRNIAGLMDIQTDEACALIDGSWQTVDAEDVEVGDLILVKPGEKIPLDGEIVEGRSSLDTTALSGESYPRDCEVGDTVLSAAINLEAALKIRVQARYEDSTAAKIVRLLEEAGMRKSSSEKFISRFARVYTPIVTLLALALSLLPPLIALALGQPADFGLWIYRGLTFLVISCPCALVISVPLTFFAALGASSRLGILIKGSSAMEVLAKLKRMVFDKTGTLTEGNFEVKAIHHNRMPSEQLLEYAAIAESASSHPISRSIIRAFGNQVDLDRLESLEERAGRGVIARIDAKEVAIGNQRLMEELGIDIIACREEAVIIHLAIDGAYEGHIVISDQIKSEAPEALAELRHLGISKLYMLSGDRRQVAEAVGTELGLEHIESELLPADKLARIEALQSESESAGLLAFVGDGINDAPALMRADVGIAMGGLGADAAIEAADLVLLDDDPRRIAEAIRLSRQALRIVSENIFFAIGIKGLCLILASLGLASMALAIFADVGVMVLAVLNAVRMLYFRGRKLHRTSPAPALSSSSPPGEAA